MTGCVFAKVSYATEAAAAKALHAIRRRSTSRHLPAYAYKCGACGSWHLTKQKTRKGRSAKRRRMGKW
jgi:hypothetical protein